MDTTGIIIGLIQMEVGQSPDVMLTRALAQVEVAAQKGAPIICLPELFRSR